MDRSLRNGYSGVLFFWIFFLYYAAYAVFSGNAVQFLTECGFSAAMCGAVTSATLAVNVVMQPAGGYVTDTYCSARRYLKVELFLFMLLCFCCTAVQGNGKAVIAGMILGAGIVYPAGQLMDAWVKMSAAVDLRLEYSVIRAGGSFGFALMSILAGQWFRRYGWYHYFLMQAFIFMFMLPLMHFLPEIPPANRPVAGGKRAVVRSLRENCGTENLSAGESFLLLIRNRNYRFCFLVCTLYWFSHRPIGSFLSLLVRDRGGDAGTYGNVCGIGAVVEFLCLLLISGLKKREILLPETLLPAALITDFFRPLCFLLFPGLLPLYAGQILQSLSFAFYLSASVECFALAADPRIRSFSISTGLSFSSVIGTVGANLLGGMLCDLRGVSVLPGICVAVAAVNMTILAGGFFSGRAGLIWPKKRK